MVRSFFSKNILFPICIIPVERNARFIETAPQYIMDEILGKLAVILLSKRDSESDFQRDSES